MWFQNIIWIKRINRSHHSRGQMCCYLKINILSLVEKYFLIVINHLIIYFKIDDAKIDWKCYWQNWQVCLSWRERTGVKWICDNCKRRVIYIKSWKFVSYIDVNIRNCVQCIYKRLSVTIWLEIKIKLVCLLVYHRQFCHIDRCKLTN